MKRVLFIIFFFAPFCLLAQEVQKKWYITPQVALLQGDRQLQAQPALVSGIRLSSRWGLGMGVGIDQYKIRTVPVFADLRYRLLEAKKNSLFFYGQLGYNMPWAKEDQHRYFSTNPAFQIDNSQFTGGRYVELGLANEFKLTKHYRLLLGVGYSEKRQSEYYSNFSIWSWARPGEDTDNRNKATYIFRRWSFRVGITL
jgi:hypothetical protein